MVRLRARQGPDVRVLVTLAQRSWKDVEASVDETLASPLDRLATPSWDDHRDAVVREACGAPEGRGRAIWSRGLDPPAT